jgi:hypothetical protein
MISVWEQSMDAERMRAMLLKLPHVAETEAWSTYVLFWAADKSIGGKLFAMMNPVNEANGVIAYAAGPERYAELRVWRTRGRSRRTPSSSHTFQDLPAPERRRGRIPTQPGTHGCTR